MARYFFNVVDGQFVVDREGFELPDVSAARAMAIETAGAILQDAGRALWNGAEWQMHVTDEQNKTVFRLNFSATQPA